MNLICTLGNLRKMRFLTFTAGAFLTSLGSSVALGVSPGKALILATASGLTAAGSFLQRPTHDDNSCDTPYTPGTP